MKVLLAAAPHRDTFGYSMPPPGLLRLGGELERRGIAVALEDLAYRLAVGELACDDTLADRAAERLIALGESAGAAHALPARRGPVTRSRPGSEPERLASASTDSREPLLIGLSVMGATLPIALAILERIRARRPSARLVLGGPGTTGVDRALVERFPFVDAVVRGEGETTLCELVERVSAARDLDGVAGITWRAATGAVRREAEREPLRDLGTLAGYARHLLPALADYARAAGDEAGLVPIDSGRGCVYDCSFCTIGRFWGRRSRTLPAQKLVDEIEDLRAIPGARSAYLCHDLFGANRGQALAFCDEMIRREVGVAWEARARADHLDRELLARMGEAGCWRVLIGIESADPAVRERNEKGLRADVDLLAVVRDCARAGIAPILSLILGLPGEDERALRTSLDFCAAASLSAGVHLSLHLVNPQPGCGLGDEFGASARPVEGVPPDMAWGAGETAPERALIAAHPDLFTTWSLLPLDALHLRDLHAIASALPEVLMRYPRTFARLCAHGSADTLDLYRAWRACGRSFEAFAQGARDPRVDATVRWEQALVRAAARGLPPAPRVGPRAAGEVIACEHDVASHADLESGSALEPKRTWLAVVPRARVDRSSPKARVERSSPEARDDRSSPQARVDAPAPDAVVAPHETKPHAVETLRISGDVARLLEGLDGRTSLAELERGRPGIGAVLERLAAAGLVEMPAGDASTSHERKIGAHG